MDTNEYFLRFGISLAIGILVGIQREFSFRDPNKEHAAGVRTFALMALIGSSSALISEILNSALPFVFAMFSISLFLGINYSYETRRGHNGLTTEVSCVMVFLSGALAFWDYLTLSVALGVVTTLLLSLKQEMHQFAHRLTQKDVFASLKFAVITVIVLPVLPNQNFGPEPLNLFNPFKIWLLVIFISGISYIGYILMQVVGPRKGIGLTGLLGGIASSTALTLSFTQRSQSEKSYGPTFALAIIIAWTVMFPRVVVEVAVLNQELLSLIVLPLSLPLITGLLYCIYLYFSDRKKETEQEMNISNPFELRPAIKFGLVFTAILAISKLAVDYLGDTGVYVSAFLSGIADVDAIALTLAELSRGSDGIAIDIAAQGIILAALANTLSKGAIVMFAGSPRLRKAILPGYLLMLASGAAGLLLV
jgi:uncharacterized membrane protein (DUF4010 family)